MMCNKVDLWLKSRWCRRAARTPPDRGYAAAAAVARAVSGVTASNATVQIFHEKSAKMEFKL